MIHSLIDFLENDTVRKTSICENPYSMEFMTALINHFIKYPDPIVVPVSNFKRIKRLMYTYDMVKLEPLSIDEDNLIDFVDNMIFDYGGRAIYFAEKNQPGIREAYPELISFLEKIVVEDRYWDIHSGNIMRNNGKYCLIDLEGFCNEPLNDPANNWITR